MSQILRNGCSDGKFREPAVNQKSKKQSAARNPPSAAQRIDGRAVILSTPPLPAVDCCRLGGHF